MTVLHFSQQQAGMLARPPTFGAVIFTKPSACFAFSSAHGTLSAKLKAPSLVLNIKPVSISFLHFGHIMINSSVSYLCVLYQSSTAPDLSVLLRSPPWSIMSGIPSSFGVRPSFRQGSRGLPSPLRRQLGVLLGAVGTVVYIIAPARARFLKKTQCVIDSAISTASQRPADLFQ